MNANEPATTAPPVARIPKWPMRTRQAHVPWFWVALMSAHWGCNQYIEFLSTTVMTFKLRPLVDSPIWITAIASFNTIFNILIGASANYTSDRVWTRWGRRRPFILAAQFVLIGGLLVIPEVNTLGPLIAILLCYEMLRDLQQPLEPLINEVIPPRQRGSGMAFSKIARQVVVMFAFGVMLGLFDRVLALPGGITVRGEQAIFWAGCLFVAYTIAVAGLSVRETPPPPRAQPARWPGLRRAVWGALRDIFGDRQWRALYLLGIAMMISWLGLGSLAPLLYTEQFGYTKQQYGLLVAIGGPALFVIMPIAGWLADRVDRILIFRTGAVLSVAGHVFFYVYARFFAPGGVPPFVFLVVFGLLTTAVSNISATASAALIFDYVPRDKLGTVSSGVGIIRGVASILINNGVGVWVTLWSGWFMPEGVFDYLSAYIYLIVLGILGTSIAFWFDHQAKTGRVIPHGRVEADG